MISPTEVLRARVLIVDDKPANVALLEGMLRGAGYTQVSSTLESARVRSLHAEHRYDLIILDLRMPGLDGFEVMEQLKTLELDGDLPVLVLTAEPEQKVRALAAGAKDFVSKPFQLAEVLRRVSTLVEARLASKRLVSAAGAAPG